MLRPGDELAGRRIRIKERCEVLELNLDKVGGIFCDIGVGGKHGDNRLTDITHPLFREHGLAIGFEPLDPALPEIDRRQVRDVGGGPHCEHAGRGPRPAGVDGEDAAMRNW